LGQHDLRDGRARQTEGREIDAEVFNAAKRPSCKKLKKEESKGGPPRKGALIKGGRAKQETS